MSRYGTVTTDDGVVVNLTEQPHLEDDYHGEMIFRAFGEDKKGNKYQVFWYTTDPRNPILTKNPHYNVSEI